MKYWKLRHFMNFHLNWNFQCNKGFFVIFKSLYILELLINVFTEKKNGKISKVVVEAGGWVHENSLYYFLKENFIIESYKKFSMWHDDILLIFF